VFFNGWQDMLVGYLCGWVRRAFSSLVENILQIQLFSGKYFIISLHI
jgi:hypothetical protein